MAVPDIPETKWIGETTQSGKDFLAEATFIQEAIQELRNLKEERLKRKEESQGNYKSESTEEERK